MPAICLEILLTCSSGPIEPRISESRNSERKLCWLIETQRRKGNKIILLARGGRYARTSYACKDGSSTKIAFRNSLGQVTMFDSSESMQLVNGQHLAQCLAAFGTVLATSAVGTQLDQIATNLIRLPYLGFDYSTVLSRVDLVIHHGKPSNMENESSADWNHRRCRYDHRRAESRGS